MLHFNAKQLQALDDLEVLRMDARMVQVIGDALPDLLRDLAPEPRRQKLAEWVEQGAERAVDMGMQAEADIAVVVTLQLARSLMSAKDQDKLRDWAGELLQRKGSSGQVKVALVEHTLARLAPTQPLAQRLSGILARVRAAYA